MLKVIARLLPLVLLFHFHPHTVRAQQLDRPPGLSLGDAVVTGFSGTVAPNPTQPRPASKSAIDLTFINPDGPSARIMGLGQPGYVWDGQLFQAPKTFDVFAKDVGQVFGVALDDQAAPNVYLAATSAFGLQIVGRGRDGLPERRKVGGPGTGWMKGQFGLDLQGDPGSVYKVDGTTGVVSLFAKVMLDGVPNPGPALGNLAYDAAHKQLFVSDLYTGMIHRFTIVDGGEPGPAYDHGVTGRGAANLAPMPFNPGNRPNIANSRFNSENPDTWGFAPPERRVWGLAVHEGRLFYSARNGATTEGPQIWSVGIQQDGSFAADARWELDVPAQPGPYPVSDIAFSQKGAMILAQRAPITASYDYSAFTRPGEPRVLRYWLETPDNPRTPSRWIAVPEEYAVGFAGNYRNTNGGVDLGYGYGRDGRIDANSCESSIWITGENLRNNPGLRDRLEPGGPLVVHGIQGSDSNAVRDANAPPWASYFIDYDDKFDDPRASGHLGVVRINRVACTGPVVVDRRPGGPSAGPGAGGGGGGGVGGGDSNGQGAACFAPTSLSLPPCTRPGQSVSLDLSTATSGVDPNWTVAPGGPPTSVSPKAWTALSGHWVEPIQKNTAASYTYTRSFNLPCPPNSYKPGSLQLSGRVAADNSVTSVILNGLPSLAACAATFIPPFACFQTPPAGTPFGAPPPPNFNQGLNVLTVTVGNQPGTPTGLSVIAKLTATCGSECVCGCPPGTVLQGKECVPQCPPPLVPGPVPGQCVCPPGTVLQGKECVPQCPPPLVPGPIPGQCVCPAGTVLQGQECVPRIVCGRPFVLNANGTACVCSAGTVRRGRECVRPVITCPRGTAKIEGRCVPRERTDRRQIERPSRMCPRGMVKVEGRCVPRERTDRRQIERPIRIPIGPRRFPGGGGAQPGGGGEQPGGGGRR